MSRFLKLFQPFLIIPRIRSPSREYTIGKRLFYTLIVATIYFILASSPILGGNPGGGDPFSFMRTITASSQGSLVELGLGPFLIAGCLMQVLFIFNIVKINPEDPIDKKLYNCAIKVLAILFTIIGAFLLIISGVYGTNIDIIWQIAILSQLVIVGIIIIYLDEFLVKGWGYGSGVALFITCIVGLHIFQSLFGLQNILEGPDKVTSARGLILAILYWLTQTDPLSTISSLFFRYSPNPTDHLRLPSLSIFSLIATIFFVIFVNYLVSLKIEAKVPSIQHEEDYSIFEINIIYLLTIPFVLTSIILSSLTFIAQFIWRIAGGQDNTNILASLIGSFRLDADTSQYIPSGGLAYYLTAPPSLITYGGGDSFVITMVTYILHFLIYLALFSLLSFIFLAKLLKQVRIRSIKTVSFLSSIGLFKLSISDAENDQVYRFNIFEIIKVWGLIVILVVILADIIGLMTTSIVLFLCISILRQFNDIRNQKVSHSQVLTFYL